MADRTIKVITKATSYALVTLDEIKAALMLPTTDTTHDVQLQMLIDMYSDMVAVFCQRTFAKETVEETWRGDAPPYENYRIFLSHWPIQEGDVASVYAPNGALIDPSTYEVETDSGKLTMLGSWAEPIVVTYTGGYDLPDEAPPSLKAAMQLLVQGAAAQLSRGLSTGVRSISHKESRVMYFDPNAKGLHPSLAIGGDTLQSLLQAYMRFEV